MKTTLITHIYNEKYFLPFWLNHHKDLFDNIIIIDYNSTDNSIQISKNIYPNVKIIPSRNSNYGSRNTDIEIMDIENGIDGIKLVLNITEFLFLKKPIKEIFIDNDKNCYKIIAYTPYSSINYDINNNNDLLSNLLNDNMIFDRDLNHSRDIHNYSNGNYTYKRKTTNNITYITKDAYIIWFGYYPMNEKFIQRKLQIQNKIHETDKTNNLHHFINKNDITKIIENNINNFKSNNLKLINNDLYNIISMMIKNKKDDNLKDDNLKDDNLKDDDDER